MIGDVELERVISTDELRRRPARVPDHGTEARAMVRLAQVMADSPRQILQTLTDEALQLCRAGSAGISIMEAEGDNQIFRWHALSGILSQHIWGTTPREFSPCGTVVDRNSVQLMTHMARHFRYFADLRPEVIEVMLVPFKVQGKTIGTVWVVMHDEQHQFDPEDERLLTNLAEFAAAAYQLRSALEARQEIDRRKDEFVAMMAHELRNPLSAARAATQYLNTRLQSMHEPELQRMTEIGQRQLRSMSRMIDDLLDMVRMRLDKFELHKEHVLLGPLMQQAVEACRSTIEAAHHRLDLSIPDKPLWVQGDPQRLIQIVSNLLNNATKYTPPGGQIELRIEQQDSDRAIIRVRDNGLGISNAMLPRIFDLYAQVHSASERAGGGLGIGLTLVRRLVELHGGAISVHSDGAGAGSEFMVTLPLSSAAMIGESIAVGDAKRARAARALRILVVDDNQDAADSLGLLLRVDGHTVQTAYDGASALELARSFRPEVALQDVAMPGMDGYEVARRLRELPEAHEVTLIALSGFSSPKDEQAARSAGFNHHLSKPVDVEALQAVLGAL